MSEPAPTSTGGAPAPWWKNKRVIGALGVLLAAHVWWLLPASEARPHVPAMAATATWMAVWWVFEVVPIPVTALLPLVLLPLAGIAPLKQVSLSYGKPILFLFLGGFMLALALERSGLHRRIALGIVRAIGSRPKRLLLGFMLASATLSMWISNTASVMVMLPIGLSVISEARARADRQLRGFETALMLGIAYAANIGGMATPVGTPPNLVFLEVMRKLFPKAPEVGFAQWMMVGLPVAVVFVFAAWVVLSRGVFSLPDDDLLRGDSGDADPIAAAAAELGPMRRDEWLAGGIFGAAALLWVTGSDLHLGDLTLPGWRGALGLKAFGDASVAVACAMLLFLVPSKDRPGETLLDWSTAQHRTPWALLLLFGGGFALAGGFKSSGLSAAIGEGVGGLSGVAPLTVIALVCVALTFLTELTSNTATTTLVLPILAHTAPALGIDPRALMIPATLSASCAFMMPVSSPTQAIVFGSGHVKIADMVRAGVWLNLVGVVLVVALFWALAGPALGIDPGVVPDWATGP